MTAQASAAAAAKTKTGRFFEDFRLGEIIRHSTPRTLTEGDRSLYLALYGGRSVIYSSAEFAAQCGLGGFPLDPMLAFHVVFGKTVADISANAVANLGYAEGRFLEPARVGDTLSAESTVIGLKEASSRTAGVVYVRTTGRRQDGAAVLSYVRWVLVRKRDAASPAPAETVPSLAGGVSAADLAAPPGLHFTDYDFDAAGAPFAFEDYRVGERIDHVDGMTVEEAEAQMATRLYQNTAKVHFNQYERSRDPSGRRLIYGGVVISTALALSVNGLETAAPVLAINGGRHVNPFVAGRTIFAWTEVLDRAELSPTVGALRLRLVATADEPCTHYPDRDAAGAYPACVLLDFDYWTAVPRR